LFHGVLMKLILLVSFFVLDVTFAKTPTSSTVQYEEQVVQFQKVITLKRGSESSLFKKEYARKIKIIASGSNFLVVRPHDQSTKDEYESILNSIRRDHRVKSIEADTVARPLKLDDCYACDHTFSPLIKDFDLFKGICDFQKGCALYPKCKDKNAAWGKLQIGADLADNITTAISDSAKSNWNLLKKSLPLVGQYSPYATVGVVDSGFDAKAIDAFSAKQITVAQGHEGAGDPNKDIDGHGTAVSGMIAAKDIGVTSNINLEVYRVTEKNAGGSTSNALLAAAIEKACKTSDIVNVSWGSLFDEIGISKANEEKWFNFARDHGCIIIKAAGNGGYKRDVKESNLDWPIVTVAASQSFGGESSFSTSGEIMAPGEGVYSVLSSAHEYSSSTADNSCDEKGVKRGPINGTSFAAPAVAGVMGQIITILKSRGQLPRDPVKKIKLVKSILYASTKVGSYFQNSSMVNALGAALIASGIEKYTENPDELIAIGKKKAEPVCKKMADDCTKIDECSAKQQCVNTLRFKVLACTPIKNEESKNLYDSLVKLSEMELVNSLSYNLPFGFVDQKTSLRLLDKSWTNNLQFGDRVDNFELGMNYLRSAKQMGLATFINGKKFLQLIRSFGSDQVLRIDSEVGTSNADKGRELQVKEIIKLFKELADRDKLEVIKNLLNDYGAESELGFLYYLNQEKDSFSKPVREAILSKIREVGDLWISKKIPLTYGDLSYTRNLPIFEMLLMNDSSLMGKLLDAVSRPVTNKNIHLVSFAIESESIPKNIRDEMASKLLKAKMKSNESQDGYYLETSLKYLLTQNSEKDRAIIEQTLLDSPIATIPFGFFYDSEYMNKDNLLTKSSINFWNQFTKKNLQRVEAITSGKVDDYDYVTVGNAWDNFRDGVIFNSKINRNQILKESESDLRKIFSKVVADYVKSDFKDYKSGEGPHNWLNREIVEFLTGNTELIKKTGMESLVKEVLAPLRDDLLKKPAPYPQDLRQAVRKLYGLGEE